MKWLAVGVERAVVSHESALQLHGLSDVLPNTVHLLVERDDRGIKPPLGVTLQTTTNVLEPSEVVTREGIRITDPVRSILDAAGAGTAPEQIEMAVRQGLSEGLMTRRSLSARADRRGGRIADLVHRAADKDRRSMRYETPEAFRTALEQRLKNEAEAGWRSADSPAKARGL